MYITKPASISFAPHTIVRVLNCMFVALMAAIASLGQTPVPSPSPAPTPITKTGSILVNNPSTVGRISKWVTSSSNGIGGIGDSVIEESTLGTLGIGTSPFSDFKVAVNGGANLGGVYGSSTGNRVGMFGQSSSGIGVRGLSGSSLGVSGFSSTSTGVQGQSVSGFGVQGFSSTGTAVLGQSSSGPGVWGTSTSNIGVVGQSTNYIGTYGFSQNSYGLFGGSQNSYGIYAQSATNFAGYFAGPVNATGRLSAGGLLLNSGSFLTFADGTIQSTAATITGVTAGTGLTGGGTAGNVTVSIANGGVNTIQLADSSVTSSKLGAAAVGSIQLADSAVNSTHLADNSVTSLKIADAAITDAKIASGTVVKSLNGLTDNLTLAAGDNVTITPSGNTLTISAAGTGGQPSYNPLQVAQLRWWGANQSGASFPVGNLPRWVTFDGSHMWVSNAADGTVSKIRASDGASLGTFSVGEGPHAVAFDGKYIWVANNGMSSNTVTKLNAATGATVDTIVVGDRPYGLAFDGTYMWVSCYQGNMVVKVRASDNQIVGSVSVASPLGLAFDGSNIWAALNLGGGRAAKISGAGTPTVLGEFAVGGFPFFVTFDGTNLWVTNTGTGDLTRLRPSDGANLGTFPGGGVNNSGASVFDGTNLWVVGGSLLKLRPSDGQVLATFPITGGMIAFDGANLWVTDLSGNTVTKH